MKTRTTVTLWVALTNLVYDRDTGVSNTTDGPRTQQAFLATGSVLPADIDPDVIQQWQSFGLIRQIAVPLPEGK